VRELTKERKGKKNKKRLERKQNVYHVAYPVISSNRKPVKKVGLQFCHQSQENHPTKYHYSSSGAPSFWRILP
jgi:ribosomal protein L44E